MYCAVVSAVDSVEVVYKRCLLPITFCGVFNDSDLSTWRWDLRQSVHPGTRRECSRSVSLLSPPLDIIPIMMIVWRLRENIMRTALCWIVWHNAHSPQHTCMSSSYRSSRFGLSHWYPYAVRRGGCLELYYCNMVEWFWWDSKVRTLVIALFTWIHSRLQNSSALPLRKWHLIGTS